MTVAATFLVTYTWTGSWLVSIAAGLFYLVLLPPLDTSIVIAAFLLFVHAVLAAETWRKPRLVTAVISGLALGLLVLTKAVFQYWLVGVALLWITGLWWDGPRRRALLPAAMALLIGAGILTLPWMVRNAVQVGHFSISGRSGELLAIRAEYGRMTWSEVRGAFAFYLPMKGALRDRAMRWLEPEVFGYRRFDRSRSNLAGFYRRTKRETGEVAARADRLDPGWRQRVRHRRLSGRDLPRQPPQHRYRTRRPYHPRPAPVAHLRSLGGDAGGPSHYIPLYPGISRHISVYPGISRILFFVRGHQGGGLGCSFGCCSWPRPMRRSVTRTWSPTRTLGPSRLRRRLPADTRRAWSAHPQIALGELWIWVTPVKWIPP